MKNGFTIFLASAVALGASWCGLVLAPMLQLGGEKLAPVLDSTATWPQPRTGEATLGLQVYRANGCAGCHTTQVRQDGIAVEVLLTGLGSVGPDDFKEFEQSLFFLPELGKFTNAMAGNLKDWNGALPKVLLTTDRKTVADEMVQRINAAGVKSEVRIVAMGADVARGWGVRRSVAADFLYDNPVQLGSLRVGPDLANIGVREPDLNRQLQHLYAPKSVVTNSTMPSFRYLFTRQKMDSKPSPDALKLPGEFAPVAGFEIVPAAAAKELAAYLSSLRANAPLYEAPFTSPQP
jgi:cbb3-type cytochrome oxidase cytochrome c subunit